MRPQSGVITISTLQLMALLVLSRIEAATIFLPAVTMAPYSPDMWIGAGMGSLLATGPLLVLGWLSVRNGGRCLVEMSCRYFGRHVGAAIGIFLSLFFVLCAACTTRHVVEAYTSAIMPDTPGLVFSVLTVLMGVYAASGGVAVLGRTSVMVFAVTVPALLLTLALPLNQMSLDNLQPFLEAPIANLAQGGLVSFSFSMQAIAGVMLFPYLKPRSPKAVARMLIAYVLISSVMLTAAAVAVIAAFGHLTPSLNYPVLSLARRISIVHLIERMETIPVMLWTATASLRIGLLLWAAAQALTRALGLPRGRALILPFGYLCVVLTSFIVANVFDMVRFYTWDVWGVYGVVVQLGMVVLLVAGHLAHRLIGGNLDGP